jgi:hypothetical protein
VLIQVSKLASRPLRRDRKLVCGERHSRSRGSASSLRHVVIGRVLGEEVGRVTIVPSEIASGLTWGPIGNSSRLSSVDEKPDLCAQIAGLMPAFGEPRVNAAEIFAHCHVRVVDLCAGTAAETLLHPDNEPWIARSRMRMSAL